MFIATDPFDHIGKAVEGGHCVRYCQKVSAVPHTSRWEPGIQVKGGDIPKGTIIATFHPVTGRYENDTSGRSHAAVYLDQDEFGIMVLDQWIGRPVETRRIGFRGGKEPNANDGDTFYVVEEAHGQG
jgi:hypothetical protein